MAKEPFDPIDGDNQASARLIRVGKRRYVANMAWRAVDNPTQANKQAREMAKRERMNLMMVYEGFSAQAGLVYAPRSTFKTYSGAYSIAAVLAKSIGDSWLGVFDLDDGNYLLVAVKDGAIVPGFDLVGDPDLIRERALSIRRANAWQAVYMPEQDEDLQAEFRDQAVKSGDLASFLEQAKHTRSHRLIATNSLFGGLLTPSSLVFLVVLLVILLGAFVYFEFIKPSEQRVSNAQLQERAQALAQEKDLAREEVAKATIRPEWVSLPLGQAMMRNCEIHMEKLPAQLINWQLKSLECRATGVVGKYEREKGGATMAQVQSQIQDYPIASVLGEIATIGYRFDAPPARNHGLEVLDEQQWMSRWVSYFQSFEESEVAQLTLKHQPHPEPPPPKARWIKLLGQEEAKVPPPWWNTYTWEMRLAGLSPAQLLSDLPSKGVVLTSAQAEYDQKVSQFEWVLKGLANMRY